MSNQFDGTGKLNRYTCSKCGFEMVTVDRVAGVTPMFFRCRSGRPCDGSMGSAMYKDIAGIPTHEWRKPTPKELKKFGPEMKDHVKMGGLCIYEISKNPA